MRVLIAEDEVVMAEAVAEGLRLQALAVDTVHDGDAALQRPAVNEYDVLGADDYLAKPFAFADLVARVRALGRRARPAAPPVLSRAGVSLDTAHREVFRDGRVVGLSRKEFAVLEELLRADGGVVTTEQLLERAWDENTDPFTNVVRVTMMTLRRKLGPPQVVETITGVGYQLR